MGEAAGTQGGRRGHRRRTYVVAGILGAFVLVVAGLVIWNLLDDGEPAPAVTSTTTAPVPTTTVSPAAHDQSAFTQAQPPAVLDYALTEITEATENEVAGDPVEAWRLTYSSPEATVDVVAAQWPDRAAAAAAFDQLLESERAAAQDESDLGTVGAAGETVGHMWLVTHADGTAVLIWQNTTAVFTLTGDAETADALKAFQLAYPM